MTGAEHYAEAERIVQNAGQDYSWRQEADRGPLMAALAEAQVHATLALAAATAHPTKPYGYQRDDESYGGQP